MRHQRAPIPACLHPLGRHHAHAITPIKQHHATQPHSPHATRNARPRARAAYEYWARLWAKQQKPPKRRSRPSRLPVYLEPDEQQALLAAAVEAGVPAELAHGRPDRPVPRLIAAVLAAGGRIPTDPQRLASRVAGLLELQRSVPGLDLHRIWKAK